jgi:RNA 3'-terminal phosphate cyclase (ATP)
MRPTQKARFFPVFEQMGARVSARIKRHGIFPRGGGRIAIRDLPADQGAGVAVTLDAAYEHVIEVVSGFGKLGLSAERTGTTAGKRMAGYEASGAFAGPYQQDQLLLPMAIAGGGVVTSVKVSQHAPADMVAKFTGRSARF